MKKKLYIATAILSVLIFAYTALAVVSTFTDINGHRYETAIQYIAGLGIVEGYDDGSYEPDSKINRAELLKIIMEANEVDVSEELTDCFTDVEDDWYAKYVCKAEELGVVGGYPDGSFLPANDINFVEALKIIELAYGAEINEGDPWYQGYLDEAEEKNLVPYDVYSNGQEITRGQMADIITRQLKYEDGTQDEYIESLPVLNSIPDTNQTQCFSASKKISCPDEGADFYGQDGTYEGSQPSYTDNGDGTITDNITGLMWLKDAGDKMNYYDAIAYGEDFEYAGYEDWRVPTIKELYSLMDFSGEDISAESSSGDNPFIDDDYFVFEYGDVSAGDRIIDSQWVTTSIYESDVMNGQECFFGVNFADGRIKCYPTQSGGNNGYFLRMVRGNSYGNNDFEDNGDGTISDNSSGLMWQEEDSGEGMIWEDALNYCEELDLAGYEDWRLPNAKELQYLVDYSRSPDTTDSAAIDSIFSVSTIVNEMGFEDYPFFWTGTTHKSEHGNDSAAYISFGECLGYMNGEFMDVHGAGCQRSDPKSGEEDDYPSWGNGPQGDIRRVFNYVRCVR